ncbi:MAG TPA: hypothetical protein VM011_05730 [Gammaproteobacteria bacterium]|nr:hypothetical protein [Gammaproteobacteria bacterium]
MKSGNVLLFQPVHAGIIAVLLLSSALLCGCAGGPALRHAGSLTDVRATVEYVDGNNLVVDAQYQPRHIVLVFPYVPGQIFGSPGSELLFTLLLTPQSELQLELENALPGLQDGATLLQTVAETAGLTIRPAQTRLARIGTFPFDAKTLEPLGEGGFIDGNTREHLILMYFNRPCVLSGTLYIDQNEYVHDIAIPAAGFHFLRVQQQGAGRHVLTRAEDISAIVFSIRLQHLQQT